MTVTNYDPRDIRVTPPALTHLRRQIASSGRSFLRLGVKESGCNGYMYTLDYIDEPGTTDRAYAVDDAVIFYVREEDVELVQGTEVDYVVEGLNASLKFKNPHASTYCGCGESFAMAQN